MCSKTIISVYHGIKHNPITYQFGASARPRVGRCNVCARASQDDDDDKEDEGAEEESWTYLTEDDIK